MTNLSSLSKATFSIAAAVAVVVAAAAVRLVHGPLAEPWDSLLEILAVGLPLGWSLWCLRGAERNIREVSAVCVQAFKGDLEARVLRDRDGGDIGRVQKSVN